MTFHCAYPRSQRSQCLPAYVCTMSVYAGGHRGKGGAVAIEGGGGAALLTGTMWPVMVMV